MDVLRFLLIKYIALRPERGYSVLGKILFITRKSFRNPKGHFGLLGQFQFPWVLVKDDLQNIRFDGLARFKNLNYKGGFFIEDLNGSLPILQEMHLDSKGKSFVGITYDQTL